MNKIKNLTITLISAFLLLLPVTTITTGLAFAASGPDINNSLCSGVELNAPTGGTPANCTIDEADAADNVNRIVTLVINIFSWIVGVVAVIMIIYGGFQYITAAGDTTKVGNAKNTILYALIGLVIVALAQVIVKFVLTSVTGN